MEYLLGVFLILYIFEYNSPKNRVVLLENNKSHNEIILENKNGIQASLDKPYTGISIDDNKITQAVDIDKVGFEKENDLVLNDGFLHPISLIYYFKQGSDELSDESKQNLVNIKKAIDKRYPCSVSVIGHSDTQGSEELNAKLSLDRAKKVYNWIKAQNLNIESINISSYGERDLLVPTEDGVNEPRNRRVEVFIR